MGLFDKFLKKEVLEEVNCEDDEIVAISDGKMIDITTVSDQMFAQKMMGDGVAFTTNADTATFCSPANGTLTVVFPTGHAYGITMENGVELLVHIGIDTVSANGDGFTLLGKKQGSKIKAGEPIVKVDMAKLRKKYDMPVMLIVTNPNEKEIGMPSPKEVKRGEVIIKL